MNSFNLLGLTNKAVSFSIIISLLDIRKTPTKCDFISHLFALPISKMDKVELRLEFRNERGSVVEEVKVYETELEKYKKVDALFDLARRKATNADETIDRILEQLNKGSIAA